MSKTWLSVAALSGFLCVALGAFGAHALKNVLDSYGRDIYDKAVLYQMFHTVALALVGLLQRQNEALALAPVGWLFICGMILFSGSLYVLALTGMKWLGALTPFGGLAFLCGWLWLAYLLLRGK
ncbi:DUF423 domain-containing protein [candidate division KSB1 bacterium]|nr:DUF423 domain-containing protein [candidate division KSB1 bacterium]